MAKPKRKRFHWAVDSSVLIAHIKGNDKYKGKDASAYSRALLERGEAGDAIITVSAIALVEVWKPHPKANPFDPPDSLDSLEALLMRSWFDVVELGRAGGALARRISQDLGIPSWDAVHVAAAVQAGAETFYCWDRDDLLRHGEVLGVKIAEPPAVPLSHERPPKLDQSTFLHPDND